MGMLTALLTVALSFSAGTVTLDKLLALSLSSPSVLIHEIEDRS